MAVCSFCENDFDEEEDDQCPWCMGEFANE